jgi:hypothetical protein
MYNAPHSTTWRYGFKEQIIDRREYDRISLDKKRMILKVWDLIHFTRSSEIREAERNCRHMSLPIDLCVYGVCVCVCVGGRGFTIVSAAKNIAKL